MSRLRATANVFRKWQAESSYLYWGNKVAHRITIDRYKVAEEHGNE